MSVSKTAVVLFNLGGPDDIKAVKPFLFNLFNDKAIIRVPQPLRWIIASVISTLRAKKARAIYQQMGGKSPILDQTVAQANALEKILSPKGYKVFVCMRYWHPMSDIVAMKVKSYMPDRIVLLPLYPQYSTTTTASSISDWDKAAKRIGLSNIPTKLICCYHDDYGFAAAHVQLIKDVYWRAAENGKPRVLFSAHGLPEKFIRAGDPYQQQVEESVERIVQILSVDSLDHRICYQSKVGPMKWIGPSTEEEVIQAGKDGVPVVVVPIAFVSEHSETLVELDVEYRQLASEHGVPSYWRVPALACEPYFIQTLADLCLGTASTHKKQCEYCKKTFPQDSDETPCKLAA